MKSLRIFVMVACVVPPCLAQQVGAPTADLDKVSIDEAFSVQVTSVVCKTQERSKEAAIFGLTAEDIRWSGVTCIPEAQEWVPGLTAPHLPGNLRVDVMAPVRSHDDALDLRGVVPIDARLAWRSTRRGGVSVSVQYLANRQVLERNPEIATPPIPVSRTLWTQRF